jgi:hypothetical protein
LVLHFARKADSGNIAEPADFREIRVGASPRASKGRIAFRSTLYDYDGKQLRRSVEWGNTRAEAFEHDDHFGLARVFVAVGSRSHLRAGIGTTEDSEEHRSDRR